MDNHPATTPLNASGMPIHPSPCGVEAFWRWFSGSKVTDAQGRPVVMYHGITGQEVDSLSGPVYLAYEHALAEAYAEEGCGKILSLYVRMLNPLVLDTPAKVREAWQASRALDGNRPFHGTEDSSQALLNAWAIALGHDGILVPASAFEGEEGYEISGGTFGEPQAVVFRPEQLKSATDNDGSFDPKDQSLTGGGGTPPSREDAVRSSARDHDCADTQSRQRTPYV